MAWFNMVSALLLLHISSGTAGRVTNVALIGATGDLAKKYLWQGLFNLYRTEHTGDHELKIFGGARVDTAKGQKLLDSILEEKLTCVTDCGSKKAEFKEIVTYRQLKSEDDYVKFCSSINETLKVSCGLDGGVKDVCYKDSNIVETGRLFYLSIPPFAYAETAKFIHKHCRPSLPNSWLRVVLEKPFGHDKESAEQLAKDLQLYLKEEEMYRIDHYLGKTVAMEILKFRKNNEDSLGPSWDNHGIGRVDIVMSETVDVQGRTLFYDEYGVIRDVMQNHLTELLVLVAMELPQNLNDVAEIHKKKLEILRQVQVLTAEDVVVGQYRGYNHHVREDFEDEEKTSHKPTFAAASVHISNNRWRGVNFQLVSGKKLNQRASYVKITFKERQSCFGEHCKEEPEVLVFNIGHGDIGQSSIALSDSLHVANMQGWRNLKFDDTRIFGRDSNRFKIYVPPKDVDAYSSLIKGVFHGNRDLFVGTDGLIASWNVWTPVVKYFDHITPMEYKGGDDVGALNFFTNGTKLQFRNSAGTDSEYHISDGMFRDKPLKLGDELNLMHAMARDILESALEAVSARGVFHLALPGGTTAPKLFQALVKLKHQFPWRQTHVWFGDERCVPWENEQSNFQTIANHLLQHVEVPHNQVHPMPVNLISGLCIDEERGDEIYSASLNRHVRDGTLDYIILGVGGDGHTASLFPHSPTLTEHKKNVIFSTGGPEKLYKRMTLTLPFINRSRKIGVLVVGKSKGNIVNILKEGVNDIQSYPIIGVEPSDGGDMTWYMDYDSFIHS